MTKELTLSKTGVIVPQTFTELMEYAKMLADSTLVPKDFQGKPGNIVIAIQMGAEVGLSPTQALQSIGVINGKPSIYGDGAAGLVRSKGNPSLFKEYEIGERGNDNWKEWNDDYGYACEIKRRGSEEITKRTFTIADAKRAGLWGKAGPWSSYPQRMLMMRARSWAMRDSHSDVLKGLAIYEETIDIEPIPEPEKGTISIEDLKPVQETEQTIKDTEKKIVETAKKLFDATEEPENKPKVSLSELRERIYKACMYLENQDINAANMAYHGFADIVEPGEPITKTDENGDKYTEYPNMKKVIAKPLKQISLEQARVVWGKIKKHFELKELNIKEILEIE